MSEVKTVSATVSIEVIVECPHCENSIDLTNEDHTNGIPQDDDSYILRQVFPSDGRDESHEKFSVEDVTCSECKNEFNVKRLDW